MNPRFEGIIPLVLYFGSRAVISFVIAMEVMNICILVKPILEYSPSLGTSCSILGLGIFLFLIINGSYMVSK